jgi:hypothetical protein
MSTADVVVLPSATFDVADGPFRTNLQFAADLAHIITQTSFVPEDMRGSEADVIATLMHGFEVGLQPMMALRAIRIIDGSPAIAALAMRGLVIARGHRIWVQEATTTRCVMRGQRRGEEDIAERSFSRDDAERAGKLGKLNYQRYPEDMFIARATARLCRSHFADVTMGLMAIEELDDETPITSSDHEPSAEPAPKRTRSRQRTSRAPLRSVPAPPVVPQLAGPPMPGSPPPAPPAPATRAASIPAAPAVTQPQQRKLHASLRDAGLAEREPGLRFCSSVIGRPLASSKELTSDEAGRIIDALEAITAAKPSAAEGSAQAAGASDAGDAEAAAAPAAASPAEDKPRRRRRSKDEQRVDQALGAWQQLGSSERLGLIAQLERLGRFDVDEEPLSCILRHYGERDLTLDGLRFLLVDLRSVPGPDTAAADFQQNVVDPAAQVQAGGEGLTLLGAEARSMMLGHALQALTPQDRSELVALVCDDLPAGAAPPAPEAVDGAYLAQRYPDLEPNPDALIALRDRLLRLLEDC